MNNPLNGSSILLPIKPSYLKKFLAKQNCSNIEQKSPKRKLIKLYIRKYPMMKVVGVAYVDKILKMPSNKL